MEHAFTSKEGIALHARMMKVEPERPLLVSHVVGVLLLVAGPLGRLHEKECSSASYGDSDRQYASTLMTRAQNAVNLLNEGRSLLCAPGYAGAANDWRIEENDDPRGFPLYLHFPGRDVYNTLGGAERGFGVGE